MVSVLCPTVVVTAWPLAVPLAQLASWVLNARSERRGQSQKPEEIYQLIEKLVPNGGLVVVFVWVAGWGGLGGAAPAMPAFCTGSTAAVHAPATSCALHLPCHLLQAGTWRSLGARTTCATSGSPSATRWVHGARASEEGWLTGGALRAVRELAGAQSWWMARTDWLPALSSALTGCTVLARLHLCLLFPHHPALQVTGQGAPKEDQQALEEGLRIPNAVYGRAG